MPTQTKFLCPSGGVNVDFSGIFEELNGGTQYGSATNFKVGTLDLTGYFHASTSANDRPSFNTGYKIGANDLSTIFRRRGFNGITITTQPTNQVVVNNSTATFSIAATAAGTPTYQWYKNSSLISGATSTTYTTGALTTANDTDSYFCRVSYNGSSIDSNSVNTRIKPYIITHPVGGSFNETDGMSLNVVAGGSATLFYQWRKNGADISGATSSLYPSSGQFQLDASTAGTYTCKVTSTYDSTGVISNGATLTIIAPLVSIGIAGYTAPYEFNETQVITITTTLTAGKAVTYQWYGPNGLITNGQNGYTIQLIGQNSQLLFNLSTANDGNYYVIATNGGGSNQSNTITVAIKAPIATISVAGNQTIYNKTDGAVFSSSITNGATNVTYQWKLNGNAVGTNNATYSTPPIDINNVGTYTLTVTNNGGSMTTSGITIYVNPYITVNPASTTVNEGGNAVFSIIAQGSGTLSYQWYRNGIAVGNSNASFADIGVTSAYNGYTYYCVVSSSIPGTSTATSYAAMATLTVAYVTEQYYQSGWSTLPGDGQINLIDNQLAGIRVTAVNYTSNSYQWQKFNGSTWDDVSGRVQNEFVWNPIVSGDAGTYRCKITNSLDGSPMYSQNFIVSVV